MTAEKHGKKLLRLHIRPGEVEHQVVEIQTVQRDGVIALQPDAQRADAAAVGSGTSQGTAVAVELLPDGFVPGP